MPKYKVTFKEEYMPREVERTCNVPSEAYVINAYDLDSPEIEWYKIEKIED